MLQHISVIVVGVFLFEFNESSLRCKGGSKAGSRQVRATWLVLMIFENR
jgi:hypothetical protein